MECQLEIQFIHRRGNIVLDFFRKLFKTFVSKELIQTVPFEIGFMFKNRGNYPLCGATVSSVRWSSVSGKQIFSTINKSFHLDTLNPGEKKEIWTGEKTGTYADGLCNINLNINSDNPADVIKTFQVNPFTKETDFCTTNNSWTDFFFIRSKNEHEQSNSNYFLLIFAVISAISSVMTMRLSQQQTNYAEVQSRSERIIQAKAEQDAISLCKQNPNLSESGLFNPSNGSSASCTEVLQRYKN